MLHDIKQIIVVRKDLKMRKGKLAAQVAHAAMKFILDNNESNKPDHINLTLSNAEAIWCKELFTKVVVGCDSLEELETLILKAQLSNVSVYPIIDSGKTEFNNEPTLTCASFGPDNSNELNKITGHLKLL